VKAVRFLSPTGETRIGALLDDHVRDAGPAGPRGFDASDEQWQAIERAAGPEHALAGVRLLHPAVPQKIAAIGLNYRSHAQETGLNVPEVPIVFAKFPSALIGPEEPIVIPREETRPDYEGEVALVIGRRTYRAESEEARAAIGGISVINDVSGRRAQLETPLRQFTLGKSFDSFAPLGPCVAHPDELELGDLRLRTVLSGELMQDSSTSLLIFSFEQLVEYISRGTTLEPGDVIATGTPGGVGDERKPPRYLREGDVVEVTVEGVGTLRNPVRLEP
jgi:2-keto-4-pentenoate hydratase/2-oxohepta-3-ene-1,7-dioic acid hydratase in catechol pathway